MQLRHALITFLAAQTAFSFAAAPSPIGELTLRGEVDFVLPEQPRFSQTGGTAVILSETNVFTHSSGSQLSFVNGDSAVLGYGTAIATEGTAESPILRLSRGAMSVYRADGSATSISVAGLSIDADGESVVSMALDDEAVATIEAVHGDLTVTSVDGALTTAVDEGSVKRFRVTGAGFDVVKTQDAPVFDEETASTIVDPDDETKEEDDDDAAYLLEDAGGEELVLFGIPLGVSAGTAAAIGIGGAVVVGGGVAIADDDDGGSGGGTPTPIRRPVSPINNDDQIIEEPPTEDPCVHPTLRGIYCPPDEAR